MTCARDQIQKFKIRFKPVSKLFFINFFLPSFSFPRLFFFGSTCRGCRRRETFPLGYEFGEESSDVEPVAYRSNYAFQLHANMASCRHSFCAYLHTPPRCYPPFSFLLPSKSHALYAFRKTARTCLEEYAVFRGFHSIFTRGILSTRGKFSKSFVN